MAKQTIDNGDSGLSSRTKINENFTEVYDNSHTRNADTILDEGGANEVSAAQILSGIARVLNPKWELNMTQLTYDIDGQEAFSLALESDSEVGSLSFKRRTKGTVWDDDGGTYYTLAEMNTWGQALSAGTQWEIGCFPNSPDFDPNDDTIDELYSVGCILKITAL